MEVKAEYKKTEVGVIPNDWAIYKVSDLTSFHKQGYYTQEPYKSDGKYYLLRGTDMQNPLIDLSTTPKINANNTDYEAYKVLPKDFLFVRSGAIGRYGIVEDSCPNSIFGSYLINFRFNNKIIPEYFGFFYQSHIAINQIIGITQGGGNININAENIKNLKIPLPLKITEQTAIATALSDTDALISSLEKLIAKKRNIKQGAMQELLKPKKGWVVKKLGEIADIIGGGTPSTFIPNYWNGTINWYTPTEIGQNKYTFESTRKITKEGLKNCSARILPIGTILLTTRAGIGDLSILTSEGCTNQGFQSFVSKDGYSNEYIYYLLLTLKSVLLQNASGSTFLEISPNKIKQIEVSIPSTKTEQIQIATILSDIDAEITSFETKLDKFKKIKLGMMQELLTGKIRLV